MVATALAAPQYGPQAPPQQPQYGGQQAAPQQFAPQQFTQQQFAPQEQAPVQAAPQVSAEQWASLNPYGSNSNAYPAEERPQIEEIQRQWAKFLE